MKQHHLPANAAFSASIIASISGSVSLPLTSRCTRLPGSARQPHWQAGSLAGQVVPSGLSGSGPAGWRLYNFHHSPLFIRNYYNPKKSVNFLSSLGWRT
jgi:hypothetical protein